MKYGQFCPIAKASEVLGERWMLLVVRELMSGATRYRDLQRGLGRISPSVLSVSYQDTAGARHRRESPIRFRARLGVSPDPSGHRPRSGHRKHRGLGPRWVRSRMTRDELDVELLMLTVQRNFDASAFPKDHAVIAFVFSDLHSPMRRWWLLIDEGHTELCSQPPGRTEDFALTCRLRTLAEVYTGDTTIHAVLEARRLETKGPPKLVRSMPRWLRVQRTPRTLLDFSPVWRYPTDLRDDRVAPEPGHELVWPILTGNLLTNVEGVVSTGRVDLEVLQNLERLKLLFDLHGHGDRRGGVVGRMAHEDRRGRREEHERRSRAAVGPRAHGSDERGPAALSLHRVGAVRLTGVETAGECERQVRSGGIADHSQTIRNHAPF